MTKFVSLIVKLRWPFLGAQNSNNTFDFESFELLKTRLFLTLKASVLVML